MQISDNNNILVIAPHPDDEILGCGGTIRRFANEEMNVFILVVTRGKPEVYSDDKVKNVRNEALKAHQIVGVKQTFFLEYPAPELDQIPISKIANDISKLIIELNIGTVFLPHRGDIHMDHQVVYSAGLVACRPVNDNPVQSVFCYETLSETEWASPEGDAVFIPTLYINIGNSFRDKLKAMKCFQSQIREFPNPRSLKSIEALANFRGSTVGCEFAEAFMTIRIIY